MDRIVSINIRYTIITPVQKKLQYGFVLDIAQCLKQPTYFQFLYFGFPKYFAVYLSFDSIFTEQCAVIVLVISLLYQRFTHVLNSLSVWL